MAQRVTRWLIALAMAAVVALSSLTSQGQPHVAHGESTTPTPTATMNTNGLPGGSGGGG